MSLSGIAVTTGRLRGPAIVISPFQTSLPVWSATSSSSLVPKLIVSFSALMLGTRLRSLTRMSLTFTRSRLIVVTGNPAPPSRGSTYPAPAKLIAGFRSGTTTRPLNVSGIVSPLAAGKPVSNSI